jgi:thiamine kinase-like enzyme
VNGRVEEFYENCRTLSCHEMNDYAPEIARLMANLHTKTVPDDILRRTQHGDIWDRVYLWLNMVKDEPLAAELKQEWIWLQSVLMEKQETNSRVDSFCREIVLTHMDMQSLNLLKPTPTGPLKLIDFEYAALNPRAADISNTWCEHCDMNNLRANYETEYPSELVQTTFLQSYLDALNVEYDEVFLDQMRLRIGQYTLISHLEWAVWALVQRTLSNIEFDYLAYAKHRMEGYDTFKKRYWSS